MESDLGDLTAFSKSAVSVRERYSDARINPVEFERKLSRCWPSCKGMCCYCGVSVDDDTAEILAELAKRRSSDFQEMGLDLPNVVVAGNITAVKPRPFRSILPGYPEHFRESACVFLTDDARCGLQVLGERLGKHPWYYKPFSCWLFPIKLAEGQIRLFDEKTDPFCYSGYEGFVSRTFCGRTSNDGLPASAALISQLDFLGRLLGRDFRDELAAVKK
jgi:hypothetical protein